MTTNDTYLAVFLGSKTSPRMRAWMALPEAERRAREQEGMAAWKTWLNRCRRLAKDWENLNRKAIAFLRLASIRLMLRKLCNPALRSRPRIFALPRRWVVERA